MSQSQNELPMLRFTIRDVLWLTVVVALGVGWWISHRQQTRYAEDQLLLWKTRANAAADVLTGEGWSVEWDEARATFEHSSGASRREYSTGSQSYLSRQPD
jgi:hypothetical protein